jgi:hypothetical protein
MRRKNWKPLPKHVSEYENILGDHFYYKERNGVGFIRFHGAWWESVSQFIYKYPNIELPREIKTRVKILNILAKYELKH